ncbi:MAG: IMP dehydrogenase [bacterium]
MKNSTNSQSFHKFNCLKDIKFDFEDILIKPSLITNIKSRYEDIFLEYNPLITAPMDTVVDINNLSNYLQFGINVCLPRTIKYVEIYDRFLNYDRVMFVDSNYNVFPSLKNVFVSVGLNECNDLLSRDVKILKKLDSLLIDVANGHMSIIDKICYKLKQKNPNLKIMIGNIANPETYRWYADNGNVDYIRIGIGNGNACLTTKQSSIGYPMGSLISEIKEIKENIITRLNNPIPEDKLPKIVADGGMKDYSDVIKALALGADYVMLGSIFNKSIESSGDNYFKGIKINQNLAEWLFNHGFKIKKYFRGMSTKEAQKAMGKTNIKTSEGIVRFRNVEYKLNDWLENFNHYLLSAMSYTNSKTLKEFIGNDNVINITKNARDRFNK